MSMFMSISVSMPMFLSIPVYMSNSKSVSVLCIYQTVRGNDL